MVIADERILEYLSENAPRQPKLLADELSELGLEYNDKYIGRRCLKLAEYGLTRNLGNGIYTITEQGEQYLDGDLRAGELEPQEDS